VTRKEACPTGPWQAPQHVDKNRFIIYIDSMLAYPVLRYGALRTFAVAALVSGLVFLACGRETGPPNVLLIGVDTLRPDHLGCYGYGRRTSPNIDKLASRGVVCERTVSQSSWTLPSFASVFTSLYPMQHGAGALRTKMRSTFPTLASLLSDAGYTTAAIISSPILDAATGVARGFQYYDVRQGGPMRTADEVTERALEWMDSGHGQPLCLFLHYWDPHDPYSPPPPYDTVFDPSYNGGLGNSVNLRTLGFSSAAQVGVTLSEESGRISDADLAHAIALYDGEIAFADSMIGELFKGMEERGLLDNTLIVLFSDHGEEFFEHNGVGHGHTLYNEVIRVVLVFAYPGHVPAGTRIANQVRSIDVTPTILDLLGLAGSAGFEGVSLVPLFEGGEQVRGSGTALFPPGVAYSEGLREGPEKKAVTAYPWKLTYELATTEEVLFDLEHDPGERDDIISAQREAADPLEALMSRALFDMSDDWYVEVSGGSDAHVFDLVISAETGPARGWVCPFKAPEGGMMKVALGGKALHETPGSRFEVKGLSTRAPVTMGFKVQAPRGMRPTMDFRMDGRSAQERTYIGETLGHPASMPFPVPERRAKTESASGPAARPEPPYILVWHVESRYGAEIPASLSDEVKKELRALGYIQ
jgi:arylsulfatase A-like enzyme